MNILVLLMEGILHQLIGSLLARYSQVVVWDFFHRQYGDGVVIFLGTNRGPGIVNASSLTWWPKDDLLFIEREETSTVSTIIHDCKMIYNGDT